ncbi:unnamed protein product [Paramecium sonneborni]|uniref:Uncharacterized protein n=1 Tax=Paramecium sonneborni TaxID=65129 RepID=A0A8S1KI23_9CILI|nr:unnamed protein product [Paramecium sonneborni]CAD8052494.1 unnamed protein product [Paramecium sonneborni]
MLNRVLELMRQFGRKSWAIHGGLQKQLYKIIFQIASITDANGKNGQCYEYRVNFIGDTSHAQLKFDKLKKWNPKPIQQENKKLKESIDLANNLIERLEKAQEIEQDNLNEHTLKDLTIKLNDLVFKKKSKQDIIQILNLISNNEKLSIVKLNLGQQYFALYQALKYGKAENYLQYTQDFIDQLKQKIGFKQQHDFLPILKKQEKSTPNSDDTKEITDSPIKKKKIEEISKDTLCYQN